MSVQSILSELKAELAKAEADFAAARAAILSKATTLQHALVWVEENWKPALVIAVVVAIIVKIL